MRFDFLNLGLALLLAMTVCSCGKEAKVKDSNSDGRALTPSIVDDGYLLKDLKTALLSNDVKAFTKLLDGNSEINLNQLIPGTGETLLSLAIINDYREIRNLLLEKGADPEALNALKQPPLITAVKHNRINSVKVLVGMNVNLDKIDFQTKDSALLMAIRNGNQEIAKLLISGGANLEVLDKDLKSSAQLAEEKNLKELSDLIRGILQASYGAPDIKSFRALIQEADVASLTTIISRYPNLPVDYDVINPLTILLEVKNKFRAYKTAELLLKYHINVNGPIEAEETPLIKAIRGQRKPFASLFLRHNANPQLIDTEGKSALIHAIELNNAELVNLLLNHSAAEKYTFRKNGKKITYNACTTAKEVGKKLTDANSKEINSQIKKSLSCGFLFWPF